jgi:diguanylate cyclase (GGDEF)-like protein
VGIRTDITDLKRAQSNLAAANERARHAMEEVQQQNVALRERDRALHIQNVLFDAALNNMSQGLLMTDRNQRLIVYNKRFLDLFTIDPSEFAPGLPTDDVFARLQQTGELPAQMVQNIHLKQRVLADARQSGSFVVSGEGGQSISVSQRPIADGGWIATYEDVSEQRRAEEHIRFAAHHDALTKLPNRVLFRIRLDEMISSLAHRDTGLALLYLDLDRFKHINDTLGHPIGDALLEAAGRRLLSCIRGADIVARLGGDEFAIALESSELPAAAQELGQRIINTLGMPYNLAGHTVIVGASIGIALADDGSMNADTLLKNADMALYQAKAKGRGVCSLFEADMERQLLTRLAIEEDLRDALDRQEFELLYQPLWDLGSNRIAGFEALIRWNHPVRGTVSPVHFIQITEETGLIHAIGAWALNRACVDAMKMPEDVKVAVNLSAAQFDTGDIVDIVADALDSSGLPANRLELEITETTLLKNNESTLALLFRLHALGVRIALDDFGTGYSSLSYLRTFPFGKIKIDQSFVREMATRADCAAIVSSIVSLANKLNITTTAEGIETIDQLDLIRATGCTEAQGYLFSVPRPLLEVLDYFMESSPTVEA